MPIYVISLKLPIRVKAQSDIEAFQRLEAVLERSYFDIWEIPQQILDEEAVFDEKLKPLQQ